MSDDEFAPGHSSKPACTHPSGGKDILYCSLFGDPHLRTFNGDFETCAIHGAWPLISNSYLAVQVTNERVGEGTATVTTKVSKLIK